MYRYFAISGACLAFIAGCDQSPPEHPKVEVTVTVEEKEKPKFGILHPVDSHNPLIVSFSSWGDLFRDLKKASGIRAWLGYLFMPPGWAPDGEGLTTRQMQAQGSIEPQSVRV